MSTTEQSKAMPSRRCVVSFADGSGDYAKKLNRLRDSVKRFSKADFIGFTSCQEIGCESHRIVPYKFKPYAIQKAREMGYTSILWCDSPVHAIKPIDHIFDYIEENSYLFFDNIGWTLGRWSNQRSLDYFGVTKEQAEQKKIIMACVMGFDFREKMVCDLFDEYKELANFLYPGSWEDHRHDQTVMSYLLDRDGFNLIEAHKTFFAYYPEHYQALDVSPDICMQSKGLGI